MTGDLLANRKHLNEILGSFCIRPKCDLCNLEAGVTSYFNGVTGIYFIVENIAFVLNNNYI